MTSKPDRAFILHTVDNSIILVQRGHSGYWPTQNMSAEQADKQNALNGVSFAEREAMAFGSLFGWDKPGAINHGQYDNATSLVVELRKIKEQENA